MSSVTVEGKCSFEPELRTVGDGLKVVKVHISFVTKYNKDNPKESEVAFIYGQAWGDKAVWAAEQIKKGDRVVIVGKFGCEKDYEKEGLTIKGKLYINASSITKMANAYEQNSQQAPKKAEKGVAFDVPEHGAGGDDLPF